MITRSLTALAALVALSAGGLGIAGIDAPIAAIAGVGGVLALIAALMPAARTESPSEPARPMAMPRKAAPVAAPPSDEVRKLRAELERQRELEVELTLAKQIAESAVMAKGEFLATMSHEVRTPLNGIIPLLDILLSSPLQPDQRDYVQTAFGSARQLLRIVDDILDFSKLEANKLTLESVGVNLREVTDGVMRLMQRSAEAKNLGFSLTIDPSVRLAVRGDPVRLRQVLTNLVSNAIKFTERGNVSLNVTRCVETRTHHELRFEVKDTGVGLTAGTAATLFKPFSQADASTTRQFGGTGLGLVICKRIIDLMGGQIGVDSQPGQGSTFWFQVPMLKAVGDMRNNEQGLQNARLMVLSSDPAQQKRFEVCIPNWGARFSHSHNTQEALSKLRAAAVRGEKFAVDVLLVDLPTVRTTYLALERAVARDPEFSSLKVVYLQGSDPLPAGLQPGGRIMVSPRGVSEGDLRRQMERFINEAGAPVSRSLDAEIRVGAPPGDPATDFQPTVVADLAKLSGHMLLVEDNPVNRQVAQRLLSLAGLTVDSAENGQEALDLLEKNSYDAILMDCQMPILDGYAATRARRAHEASRKLPRIPIIAMTANAMVGDREKCIDSGMDDYLTKPINRAVLTSTLKRWIADRPVVAPKAAASPAAATKPLLSAVANIPVPTQASLRSGAAHSAPAITLEVVEDLREIMGAEFGALVNVFLEDAPKSLQRLDLAAAADDVDGMVGPAHSLKSTSANLGAMELSAQAKNIEFGARQKTLTDLPGLVMSLTQEFRRAETELRRMLS